MIFIFNLSSQEAESFHGMFTHSIGNLTDGNKDKKPGYYLDVNKDNYYKLLNDKKLRDKLGENGRKFLKENLNIEKAYHIVMKHFE